MRDDRPIGFAWVDHGSPTNPVLMHHTADGPMPYCQIPAFLGDSAGIDLAFRLIDLARTIEEFKIKLPEGMSIKLKDFEVTGGRDGVITFTYRPG